MRVKPNTLLSLFRLVPLKLSHKRSSESIPEASAS